MSAARQQILAAIRRQLPVDAPLPSLDGPWIRYDNPQRQVLETLVAVGGRGAVVGDAADLRAQLAALIAELGAQRVFSAVPAAAPGNVPWESIDDGHDLADVDLAIVPGELAVAENAAVWVTDGVLPQRSAYFLSQHLALVVPKDRLVHTMHEAYQWLADRVPDGRPFAEASFGCFISGPSKTADIEQSLVIGAHGARSLTLFLV